MSSKFRWFLLPVMLGCGNVYGEAGNAVSDDRKQELDYMLRHDCGSCHGMSLRGGLGPAITSEALHGKPEQYVFQTIRDGHPGTPMPPWLGILTEQEIHYLVDVLLAGEEET